MKLKKTLADIGNYSPLLRPFRAMIIAYGYVLRGEKVQKPLKWKSI